MSLQLSEARAEYAETVRLKHALENSIFDIQSGTRAANESLVPLRQQGGASSALLAALRDETERTGKDLTRKRLDLRKYTSSYRALLARIGRAPDLSVGPVGMGEADKAGERAIIAAREAQMQAPSYTAAEALAEVMGGDNPGEDVDLSAHHKSGRDASSNSGKHSPADRDGGHGSGQGNSPSASAGSQAGSAPAPLAAPAAAPHVAPGGSLPVAAAPAPPPTHG